MSVLLEKQTFHHEDSFSGQWEFGVPNAALGSGSILFFFITLEPIVEQYESLWALSTSSSWAVGVRGVECGGALEQSRRSFISSPL